jgi:hypothetical protein
MAVNVDVTENQNSIDINDVDIFSIDVTDLSNVGSVTVADISSTLDSQTIQESTVIRTISLPAEDLTIVEVKDINTDTVTITTTETKVIEVTDDLSIVLSAADAVNRANRNFQADSLWNQTGADINYTDGNVGIGLTDPNFGLETSTDLFSPIVSSSRIQIQGDGSQDLFLVKLDDDTDSKFVINLQGVTVLGAFDTTPNAVVGGMFYSASGHFYLGF